MWHKVHTDEDINAFMKMNKNLHDSCLKEIKYISGAYVEKNFSMQAINSQRNLWLYIQTQNNKAPAIELLFEGVVNFNLTPRTEEFDCVIYDSSFTKKGEVFCWADYTEIDWEHPEFGYGTWVIAQAVSWRVVPCGLGKQKVY